MAPRLYLGYLIEAEIDFRSTTYDSMYISRACSLSRTGNTLDIIICFRACFVSVSYFQGLFFVSFCGQKENNSAHDRKVSKNDSFLWPFSDSRYFPFPSTTT
jgi:hypothetical protein